MKTVKDEVREMLDNLPDDISFEDIQYHIYVREKIQKGLNDIEKANVVGHKEAEKRMAGWLGR